MCKKILIISVQKIFLLLREDIILEDRIAATLIFQLPKMILEIIVHVLASLW